MEKIKEIVSDFIRVPVEQIGPATPIGRSAVQSSILLHRMFARLADEGIRFSDYSSIKVFGDLSPDAGTTAAQNSPVVQPPASPVTVATHDGGIGIDIEEVSSLPKTDDFRKDEFYRMNFSPEEMAWCILRQDPYSSFTGLFAAKEAIIKAAAQPDNRRFDTIRIAHSPEGKPLYPGYTLSISHAGGLAVAVAVREPRPDERSATMAFAAAETPRKGRGSWMALVALLLSLAALSIVLIRRA